MKAETYTGAILWRGASELDGAPIMVIAAGLNGSRNAKTGAGMVQIYIIRADVSPADAIRTGADASICGDCMHRGRRLEDGSIADRTCYVTIWQGPRVVYEIASAGRYQHVDIETAADMLAGRIIRLGAYGDPAAVPFYVWQALLTRAKACTGYTHQWRLFPELAAYCMASCDSPADRAAAKIMGFRTFRVRAPGEALEDREIVCPAAKEAGAKTTCDACRACGGHSARARVDVSILAHGAIGRVRFGAARDARIAS